MRRPGRRPHALRRAPVLLALAIACAQAPATPPRNARAVRLVAGSELVLRVREVAGRSPQAVLAAALDEAERVAGLLLSELPGSEIDVLNRIPSGIWMSVSPETASALATALRVAESTGGAYDPTDSVLPAVWGLEDGAPRTPRAFELDRSLGRVDWTRVELDESEPRARRLERRGRVDLGPVAEGAVLDAALHELRGAGVAAAAARWRGGEAVFGGSAASPWWSDLPLERGRLALQDGAVAFALPTRRTPLPDGGEVHELLDPRNGRAPLELAWSAAVAESAAEAGALARAFFSMGRAETAVWLAEQPAAPLPAVLWEERTGALGASPGLAVRWREAQSAR